MEKKPRRQGHVILNVIVGIYKQKGCTCGNTVITKLQFFWVVKGGMSVQVVKKVKLSLGNQRYSITHSLPRHGLQASGHLAHKPHRVGWESPGAGLDVWGNGRVGISVFCVTRRNVETLEVGFFNAWRPNVMQPIKTWHFLRECYIFHKYSNFLFWTCELFRMKIDFKYISVVQFWSFQVSWWINFVLKFSTKFNVFQRRYIINTVNVRLDNCLTVYVLCKCPLPKAAGCFYEHYCHMCQIISAVSVWNFVFAVKANLNC